jgi:hypothetical protein
MDSKSAKQLLIETENFLAGLPTLGEIITYGQKHKQIQILPYDISHVNIYFSEDITIDQGACALLPDEFNHYICANTTGDGNCLYNAVSYFLIKDDLLATQLRLSVILELMAYANEYLKLEVFEKDYAYSDQAFTNSNNKKYQQLEYRNIAPFIAEIKRMCYIGAWCSLGAFYGLASVLKRPIQSIYPPVKSSLLRDFTRLIKPRQQKYNVAITILWSVLGINEKNSKESLSTGYIRPNHFVGCYLKVFIICFNYAFILYIIINI